MHGFQKLGGIIALIQAISFVLLLFGFGVLLPGQGLPITGLNDPSKVLPVIGSGAFAMLNAITVADAVMVILIVLALYERLESRSPALLRLAVISAVIASALFLANGLIGFAGADLGNLSTQNKAAAEAAFYAVNDVHGGSLNAAIFAASVSAVLWAWAGMAKNALPTILTWVVLLGGVVGLLSIAVTPLLPVLFVVNTVWSVWLGIILLQKPTPAAVST